VIDESAPETEEEEPEEPPLHQVPGKAPKDEEKLVPMAPKRKRNPQNDEYWDSVVGKRSSTREQKPTAKAQIQAVGTDPDHPTEEQARNSPIAAEWAKARARERAQLEKYQVFTKVQKADIPEGTKIVDTKWVYLVKRRADGSVEKYKARKVGRGFTQEAGVNYDETYAQMMRPETLKILLVIALHRKWTIRQWDVVAAYLQALLRHDVYITDINEDGETEYWKLDKALCGLKQAGHEWSKVLCEILGTLGMHQCIGDEGTYTTEKCNLIIGTHVDDLVGIAPTEKELDDTERVMGQRVELDKRGQPSNLLGMELHWSKEQVVLTQTRLIESMISQHLNGSSGGKHSLPINPDAYRKAGKVPISGRKPIVRGQDDQARNIRTCQPPGKKSKGCHQYTLENSTPGLMVFRVNEIGRAGPAETPGSLPENIYRRGIWGRGFEVPDGGNDMLWGTADWMVQSVTGCSVVIGNGSRIYRGLRRGQGCLPPGDNNS